VRGHQVVGICEGDELARSFFKARVSRAAVSAVDHAKNFDSSVAAGEILGNCP
jgi:hypothetical protein